jgi:hypothetical protein
MIFCIASTQSNEEKEGKGKKKQEKHRQFWGEPPHTRHLKR